MEIARTSGTPPSSRVESCSPKKMMSSDPTEDPKEKPLTEDGVSTWMDNSTPWETTFWMASSSLAASTLPETMAPFASWTEYR